MAHDHDDEIDKIDLMVEREHTRERKMRRDMFAAAALTGLLAGNEPASQYAVIVRQAWVLADAMLEAQ